MVKFTQRFVLKKVHETPTHVLRVGLGRSVDERHLMGLELQKKNVTRGYNVIDRAVLYANDLIKLGEHQPALRSLIDEMSAPDFNPSKSSQFFG